jgi:hypothetical protein
MMPKSPAVATGTVSHELVPHWIDHFSEMISSGSKNAASGRIPTAFAS